MGYLNQVGKSRGFRKQKFRSRIITRAWPTWRLTPVRFSIELFLRKKKTIIYASHTHFGITGAKHD